MYTKYTHMKYTYIHTHIHTCIKQQFPKRDFRHASLFGDARARAAQLQHTRNTEGLPVTAETSFPNRPNRDIYNRYNDDEHVTDSESIPQTFPNSRASGGGNLDDIDFAGDPVLRDRLAGLLEEYGSRRVMELLQRYTGAS
jgi:hypothetical protein